MRNVLHEAAPGFDDPIGLLAACHVRIQQRCALLTRIVEHMKKHGADKDAAGACRQVLHYFQTSAPHHHDDEEQDLFPALLAACPPARRTHLKQTIDALNAEHVDMAAAWAELAPQLRAVEAGEAQSIDADLIDRFQTLYIAHIEQEERVAYAEAAECLSAAELECIGRSMAARRGVAYPDAGEL